MISGLANDATFKAEWDFEREKPFDENDNLQRYKATGWSNLVSLIRENYQARKIGKENSEQHTFPHGLVI